MKTYILLALLLLPATLALTTDKNTYLEGDTINIQTNEPLTIITPTASYEVLGTPNNIAYPTTTPGSYTLKTKTQTKTVTVSPATDILISATTGPRIARARKEAGKTTFTIQELGTITIYGNTETTRITPDLGPRWGFTRTYAVDPTTQETDKIELTITAQDKALYKCAEYNYAAETCTGSWHYVQPLTPGKEYTITVQDTDPVYGEGDNEAIPDSCRFWDDTGAGNGDVNTNCQTEIITLDGGTTADLQDLEAKGGPSQIQINYTNNFQILSINDINVTYTYQRQPNTEVGDTTATIQVWDNNAWTTACTDPAVDTTKWENITCPLSTWITGGEGNDVRTRILFDTTKSGAGTSEGTVWVDYSYLQIDFVYDDTTPPTYNNINASLPSPKTYDAQPTNFSVDWTDDGTMDAVSIMHNFTGSLTTTPVTGGPTYTYSPTLGAGNYTWRMIANDTTGNTNDTMPYQTYIITPASGDITLLINGSESNLTMHEDQTITINATRNDGETTMTLYENDAPIASGTTINLDRTYNTPGTYRLVLNMSATQNYSRAETQWNITVQDKTPPPGVTNLQNTSATTNTILWNWTNPGGDFDHVEVRINGTFYDNTSNDNINVMGLDADTLYQIQLRSVDTSGNINTTDVTDDAKTLTSTDTTPPIITNISNTALTDHSARINWNTNEPADSLIKYGETTSIYPYTEWDMSDTTTHNITLTPLKPSTTYYYVINTTDPAGNSNETTEYTFTTGTDATPPTYEAINTNPATPTTYPANPTFNVTWKDNGIMENVTIEHNFTGTLHNDSTDNAGDYYTYTTSLGAGNYTWRMIANDTTGNTNDTMPYQTYIVTPGTGSVNLLLNGTDNNLTMHEDQTINLSVEQTAGEGIIELFENDTLLQQSIGSHRLLRLYSNPGIYLIRARQNKTQNYTAATENHTLTVQDTTPPSITPQYPLEGVVITRDTFTLEWVAQDNVMTQNCTVYINDTQEGTNTSITDGSTATLTTTKTAGLYNWHVDCVDTSNNRQNSTTQNFSVTIIPAWIPTTATHNLDGTVTAAVNTTGGTRSRVDQGEYITVTAWNDAAPSNANITGLIATCEVEEAQRGAVTSFQYDTGTGFSASVCTQPVDASGNLTCDLHAQGVDTVAELNNLDVRCLITDPGGPPNAYAFIDYIFLEPEWTLIQQPDFHIENIQVPTGMNEDDTIQLNATVNNTGVVGGTVTIRFYDTTRSVTIQDKTTYVGPDSTATVNTTWNAKIGRTNLTVIADPDNTIAESDETNNNLSTDIDVDAWSVYYGSTIARYWILSDSTHQNYNWSNTNLEGNIYSIDIDATVTMLNLQSLTRTTTGTYNFDNLADADTHLGMTGWSDSINDTYSNGGALKNTATFTVFGTAITDVPVINSTGTQAFITGILYDMDDDTNGDYDGEEDLVFITKVNLSQLGSYGTYDYELRIPALLRNDTPSDDTVELYIEVT